MDHISDQDLTAAYKKRFTIPNGEFLNSAEKTAQHVTAFLGSKITEREYFLVILLNNRNHLLETVILFKGSLTASAVYAGEILKLALRKNAAALIIAHNHPSGNMESSPADKMLTTKIKDAVKLVDLNLLDHIIVVPGGDFYSFSDAGLI